MRISVVELYNEELSDLIASSDTEAGMLRKLRLLEDPKKGVVLQVEPNATVERGRFRTRLWYKTFILIGL